MRKFLLVSLLIISVFGFNNSTVSAHQSGCHAWHSCPSDTGSYTCGDTGHSNYCPTYTTPTPIVTYDYSYETQEIPYKTIRVEDENVLKGETVINQAGISGTKRITYKITYENFVEKSRTKDSEGVITASTDEIIAIGTKEPNTDSAQTEQGYVDGAADQQNETEPAVIVLMLLFATIGGIVWYMRRKSKIK